MLSWREFLLWFLYGLWHAAAVFWGWQLLWAAGLEIPLSLARNCFGRAIYTTAVILVNLKASRR